MSDLVKSIEKHFKKRPGQAKLSETTLLGEIEDTELREGLTALYKHEDLTARLLGTVLNSIFTQHRAVFLFSRPIFNELLANDKNSKKRKSVSGTEYNELLSAIEGVFLTKLRAPENGQRLASVYKLSHQDWLTHLKASISEAIIKAQEKQCIDLFGSPHKVRKLDAESEVKADEPKVKAEPAQRVVAPEKVEPAQTPTKPVEERRVLDHTADPASIVYGLIAPPSPRKKE